MSGFSQKALEAIMDWEKSTQAMYIGGPFFARYFGEDGMVLFEIKNWNEGIALSLIKTPPEYRGKGFASRALKELISFADKHGVPITGVVDAQKDEAPTLNKTALKKWYGRHGFKHQPGDRIHRAPQTAASKVVETLLETDVDPVDFVKSRATTWDMYPLQNRVSDIPGGVRRKGDGYSDQWEFPYKDWKFVVSTYEDGTQIWSAHYKNPLFSWSTEEEKAQGFSWSGGSEPQQLPAGTDPLIYLERLKKMADENPSEKIWRMRHIPYMPSPDGPERYRGNY
jgi:GNAT superfamily N-acetyltransferase